MEYSIKELSQISGVSTRTLRWYDEIDLLKPSRIGQNGYRYYSQDEVERLQDILYYKALKVELAKIKECLDSSSLNRLDTLYSHLNALRKEKEQLDLLIKSVQKSINAEKRNEIMSNEERFEAFKKRAVEANEEKYGKELREKYGDKEIDEANKKVLNTTPKQYETWVMLGDKIQENLENAVKQGKSYKEEEGKIITELHKQWLTLSGTPYDTAKHKGIAELYVLDERFTAYYDKNVSGCAEFLRNSINYWVK